MTCPIEWLFMPEDKYMPLKEERYKELRANQFCHIGDTDIPVLI